MSDVHSLEEVFGPGQIRYIPKRFNTVEKLALADSREIPVKRGYEYIRAARGFLADKFVKVIKRDGYDVIITFKEKPPYPENFAKKLFHAIISTFVPGVWSHKEFLKFVSLSDFECRYRFELERALEKIEYESSREYLKREFEGFREKEFMKLEVPKRVERRVEEEVPKDLFETIVGYEDVKQLFNRSLESERPVHILLVGPPGSAKTLFLLEVERLPNTYYALGSASSRAGIADLLITRQPKYLLIDELDKMSREDYAILLSLAETGRVEETKYGKTRGVQLKTWIFAAANNKRGIPRELLSRFEVLNFPEYDEKKFMETSIHILKEKEGVEESLAKYISSKVWKELRIRDVREAIRIARMAKNKESIDEVIRTISKYKRLE